VIALCAASLSIIEAAAIPNQVRRAVDACPVCGTDLLFGEIAG